jgi:CysZ protein
MPVGKRLGLVSRNLGAMAGFGVGLGLLSLVPCALFLVLPAGVAGATRLTRAIELFEEAPLATRLKTGRCRT